MLLSIVLQQRDKRIDSRHGKYEAAEGEPIAEYRIICVVRRADGHLHALGYSESGNGVMYDDVWTIPEARKTLESGHRLYTVSPSTGDRAELEAYEEGIRVKPGNGADHDLGDLPACG